MTTPIEELIKNAIEIKDIFTVKEMTRIIGIQANQRKEIYPLLLGIREGIKLNMEKVEEVDEFLPFYTPVFSSNLSEIMKSLALIIGNLQGDKTALAQVALPLLSLDLETDKICSLVDKIVNLYIPLIKKENKEVVEGICVIFNMIIQYHCPELIKKFTEVKVDLKKFVVNEICMLCLPLIESVQGKLQLIDQLLLSSDQMLHFYVLISHVILLKDVLLKAPSAEAVISGINSKIPEDEIKKVVGFAKALVSNTPISITKQLFACITNSPQYQRWVYSTITTGNVAIVSPKDIFADKNNRGFSLFLIDGRKREMYLSGTIPGAINIDASSIQSEPENIEKFIKDIESLKKSNTHIVVFGNTDHRDTIEQIQQIMIWLIKNGFRHVSELHNGFTGYHYLFDNEKGFPVENHSLTNCSICRKQGVEGVNNLIRATESVGTKAFEFAKGWFGTAVASMTVKDSSDVKDVKDIQQESIKTETKEVIQPKQETTQVQKEEKRVEGNKEESDYYEELMKTEFHISGEIIGDKNESVIIIVTNREMILINEIDGKYQLIKKIPLVLLKKVSMKKATSDVITFNGVPPHLPLTIKSENAQSFLQFLKSKSAKKENKKTE
ncbi:hypothetical protein EDI_044970 [Entamoeba dispar SAW760]|uniref:Rhodanese domain-containing protein n=1 Tax=Entamoeba dispar (strain ATCC PRA-260 / SAW760) TaxID=370354 RepID=B0EHZ7_ENTDS|nr:uncharacterized protein EDI_044970 [Entamoeba dispar SAW760]EDR25941.1 hypothetical protein EDI_044970 [Entamoeba dispar SAW760]|eukprot:EDR25941.1 hypothetical protein EDI_044970 [Entamoeba dispar SAW760]